MDRVPLTRRCPFIQRLRGHIAANLAMVIAILTLRKIKVDPSGLHLTDKGRMGVDSAERAPAEPEG